MLSVFDQGAHAPCPSPFNLTEYVLGAANSPDAATALRLVGADSAEVWTYGALRRAVFGTASGLLGHGLRAGDILLMRVGNSVDFPILFLAAIAVGVVPVPTSAQLTEREVARQIEVLAPKAIVRAPGIACPPTANTIALDTARGWRDSPAAAPVKGEADRLAYIVFTSGTSGTPRAVAHAHRAVWARRMMIDDWAGLRATDRLMHAGAFNWTYTLGTGLLDPWTCGATAIIPQEGTPTRALMPLLAREKATVFAAAPGVYRQMLRDTPEARLPDLRHGLSAGEKLATSLAERWQAVTRTPIFEAYGMSECSTFISSSPDRPARPNALGQPQRGRKLAVVDARGPVALGMPGTIAVHQSDPGLMLGYLGDKEATQARFQGEWFLTGDQAVADNAFHITYLGRDDDMINAGGLRVSPIEIESVLNAHPCITASAAVEARISDDTAVIALYYTAAAKVDETALHGYVSDKLARYKQPRLYFHLAELPAGANGKIHRRVLRDRSKAEND
ncbi:MAG: class I adenylate-forming enzyme family protein [Roseobacter sp.]